MAGLGLARSRGGGASVAGVESEEGGEGEENGVGIWEKWASGRGVTREGTQGMGLIAPRSCIENERCGPVYIEQAQSLEPSGGCWKGGQFVAVG